MTVVAVVNAFLHPIPLYGTESDLVGEYIPAAREIGRLVLNPERFTTKGPGFPALLALASPIAFGDLFVAAKLVNTIAAAMVIWATFLLFGRLLDPRTGLVIAIGVLVNPAFLQAAVEAGTDLPALAMALGATHLVINSSRLGSLVLAGLLAGFAGLTRSNYGFLVIAGFVWILRSPGPRRGLVPYLLGFMVPLAAWLAALYGATGTPPRDGNYLNLAYMVYGANTPWEVFMTTTARQLHSYRDVLSLDPGLVSWRVTMNFASRWLSDVSQLLPTPLGATAVLGMLWCWPRRQVWPALVVHFVLGYVVLCLVFYSPRFSLYLLPFYLSGIALLLDRERLAQRLAEAGRSTIWSRFTVVAAMPTLVVLYGISTTLAVWQVGALLARPPLEVRDVGLQLRRSVGSGARVMARKPHVAYYAAMEYVPLPRTPSLADLIVAVRNAGVEYLFISSVEANLRPEYAVLTDSGLALPGLRQIIHRSDRFGSGSAVYAVEQPPANEADLRALVVECLEAPHRRVTWERAIAVGTELLYAGQPRRALDHLAVAGRMRPADPDIPSLMSNAYHALGMYDAAARECMRAMDLGTATPAHHDQLGRIRYLQMRYVEASASYRKAIELEPAVVDRRYLLGLAEFAAGEYGSAAREFLAYLGAVPTSMDALRMGALSLARSGDTAGAVRLLESATAEVQADAGLRALADSLRR